MAEQKKWHIAEVLEEDDGEEALSLCDLPVRSDHDHHRKRSEDFGESDKNANPEEFEFHTAGGGVGRREGDLVFTVAELDMCAADEVFFQGQILPLRPSVSSDNAAAVVIKLNDKRRCNSISRQSSSELSSLGFSSSGSITRSHSSGSATSSDTPPPAPLMKISANSFHYYSHPSPSPQIRRSPKSITPGRRSTGSAPPAGWSSLLRLGVVKTPEIELHDLHSRRAAAGNAMFAGGKEMEIKKKLSSPTRFLGFACKCSPDGVDADVPSTKVEIEKKKRLKEEKKITCLQRKHDQEQKSRVCEWLDELSITKS